MNLSIPLTSNLTLGLGALYTSTVDTRVNNLGLNDTLDYSELDLTASLTYDAKFAKFQLVYTSYQFFDGFSGTTFGPAGSARFELANITFCTLTNSALSPVRLSPV